MNGFYLAARNMVESTYQVALGEAYRKRNAIRWVSIDSATHAVLAEAYQLQREEEWLACTSHFFPFPAEDPVLRRSPDGTAPPLETIYFLPVRIDDAVEGIEWDTGPEPMLAWGLLQFNTDPEETTWPPSATC